MFYVSTSTFVCGSGPSVFSLQPSDINSLPAGISTLELNGCAWRIHGMQLHFIDISIQHATLTVGGSITANQYVFGLRSEFMRAILMTDESARSGRCEHGWGSWGHRMASMIVV